MPVSSRRRAGARPFVIAIDGPAGAGKTTVARGVARALGLAHLDTGAMYRAVTARALAEGVDPGDGPALARLASGLRISFGRSGLKVEGRAPGAEIRSRRVSRAVSQVSAHAGVRRALVRHQREILRRGGVVAEGRDIGTVVFPRAAVKVFLTASITERARRRHRDLAGAGDDVRLPALRREIGRRDALDATRKVSPLTPAADAIVIDSTATAPARIVARIVALAREARSPRGRA
jgi:cytidylate kinase